MIKKIIPSFLEGYLSSFLDIHYLFYTLFVTLVEAMFFYYFFASAFGSSTQAALFIMLATPLWDLVKTPLRLVSDNLSGNLDVLYTRPCGILFQYYFRGLSRALFPYFLYSLVVLFGFGLVPPYWYFLPASFVLAYTAGFFYYLIPATFTFYIGRSTAVGSLFSAFIYLSILFPAPLLPKELRVFSLNPAALVTTYPLSLSIEGYIPFEFFLGVIILAIVSLGVYAAGKRRFVVYGG